MKAICREAYGLPEVLELREIDKPAPADDEVLVRVRAASVNPVDWHALTGTPYLVRTQEGLRRPKGQRVGTDFAGTIEATGKAVERFQPGADVFGVRDGALAEYVCIREDRALAVKPANVSFEQAAAVPVAGVTALQGLRDKGGLKPGQKVVVNGASGGVGTFAVQIAKALGAEVTAVCSTRNLDQARALGADRVIDYTREDFTRSAGPCDVLLDIAGNRSWRDSRRVLAPGGTLVVVGGPKQNRVVGPLGKQLWLKLRSVPGDRRVEMMLAKVTREELEFLGGLLEDGSVDAGDRADLRAGRDRRGVRPARPGARTGQARGCDRLDRRVEQLGVLALGRCAVHVDEQLLVTVIRGLQLGAGLDVDQAADRDLDSLGRLAQVHRQRAGDRHERLLLQRMAVTAPLRPGLVAPEVRARVREAGELAQLGDVPRGLAGLVRARLPGELSVVDRAECHQCSSKPTWADA